MLEKELEAYLTKRVKELGGRSYKWVSPGNDGVPDRIIVLPKGKTLFVELKQPGKKPTPLQAKVMQQLRDLGSAVTWTDSKEGVDEILTSAISADSH